MIKDWLLRSTRRGIAFWALFAVCSMVICQGAGAASTCAGRYSASLIHPLPSPNVVLLPNAQTDLGDRFVAGLQRAGVVITGQPTTRLNVTSMVIPAPGIVSRHPGSYHGFGWALDTSTSADSVVSSTLEVTASLTNMQTQEINWVASLSCKILTNDKGGTIEAIAELLGRALGKNVDATQF